MRVIGVTILAAACAMAGCGQKGPLYLPPAQPASQSKAPAKAPEARAADRPFPDVPATDEKK